MKLIIWNRQNIVKKNIMISKEEVIHIAKLARLNLPESELEKFQRNIDHLKGFIPYAIYRYLIICGFPAGSLIAQNSRYSVFSLHEENT